ncbi:MAG: DUF1016 N-terminal domain-containing protein [Treponema sp.]|nr:DUF1016 N-terminal domain-containing protein [Treponema sp.]
MAKDKLPARLNTVIARQDKQFFIEIAEILSEARETAYKTVNTVMVKTNWQIGKRIVEHEQKGKSRAGYGDYLIVGLSRYLTDILGKGFSEANIKNFVTVQDFIKTKYILLYVVDSLLSQIQL